MILEYFVPGFVFITTYLLLTSRKSVNQTYDLVGCVVVSYLIKAMLVYCHSFILKDKLFSWNERALISSITAFILSITLVYITERKWFNKLWIKINNKSVHDDIWQDIIDYNGTTLRVICDKGNLIYTGILVGHEEKGLDSWFVLKSCVIEDKDKIINSIDNSLVSINLKLVDRIELYYGSTKPGKGTRIIDYILNKVKRRIK